MRAVRWQRWLLWLALALPGLAMIRSLASGAGLAMDLLHPSGELSVRLMILAMLPGPLLDAFGPNRFLRGWIAIRRNLGVAAFAYAVLHLGIYVIDMQSFPAMLEELLLASIWTGWLALILMAGPASISNPAGMRWLGPRWKPVQRLAYPAFMIGLLHWWLLDRTMVPALVHLAPLMLVWSLRAVSLIRGRPFNRSMS